MTPQEFKSWRKRLGLTQERAGAALGYTARQIIKFEKGINQRGEPCVVPRSVELACKWLEHEARRKIVRPARGIYPGYGREDWA